VEDRGLEPPQETSGNTGVAAKRGAESGAVGGGSAPDDPELAAVVDAWPTLPEGVKGDIVAMVKGARDD